MRARERSGWLAGLPMPACAGAALAQASDAFAGQDRDAPPPAEAVCAVPLAVPAENPQDYNVMFDDLDARLGAKWTSYAGLRAVNLDAGAYEAVADFDAPCASVLREAMAADLSGQVAR